MNTVLLDKLIVGIYTDEDLPRMLKELSGYYDVSEKEFVVKKLVGKEW